MTTSAAQALKAGDITTALVGSSRLAKAKPDNSTALRYLAITPDRLERLPEVQQIYQCALQIDPDSVATLFHLAVSHYKSRNYPQARHYFTEIIGKAEKTRYGQLAHQYLNTWKNSWQKYNALAYQPFWVCTGN